MKRPSLVPVILLVFMSTRAWAGDVPAPTRPFDLTGAKTYSVICVHEETGDVPGLRIFVRGPSPSPRVVVQFAEGVLGDILVARSWTRAGRLYFATEGTALFPAIRGEIRTRTAILDPAVGDIRTLPIRNDLHGFPNCG